MSEVLTFLGVAIAALIGGSGITGALAALLDFTKRGRLRRRIDKGVTLHDLLPEGSPERNALAYAIALDAARLGALSAVGVKNATLDRLPLFIGSGITYLVAMTIVALTIPSEYARGFVLGANGGFTWRISIVVFGLATAVGAAIAIKVVKPNGIGKRRRDWVNAVISGTDPHDATKNAQE